ncbi:zinc-finger [Lentzea xinjiangensis]|uniref:Zinc-finger n=2 Tax=Lentzea xinjiangensis TaxID=402600 RepID=A0A1H9S014_9PSEU|nr:zinc-finger [Lentzea xinjiangensis]
MTVTAHVAAGVPMNLSGLTPPEPFRWFPYLGARHAVPRRPVLPGAQIESLCGDELIVPNVEPPKYPDWLWPECAACDSRWREKTGRSKRPQLPAPGGARGARP